jgi:hypothetical protein
VGVTSATAVESGFRPMGFVGGGGLDVAGRVRHREGPWSMRLIGHGRCRLVRRGELTQGDEVGMGCERDLIIDAPERSKFSAGD